MTYINYPFSPRPFNFYARMLRNKKPKLVEPLPPPPANHDNVLYLHNDPRFSQYREMINSSRPASLLTSTKSEPDWTPPKAS